MTENDNTLEPLHGPSWLRWPPNCCQTCKGWQPDPSDQWIGTCMQGESLEVSTRTDSRYRCPAFTRKDGI